jgi:hypothetical protein
MSKNKYLYIVEWTQPYTEYQLYQEAIVEMWVENSELREAKAVLKQIMDIK